MANRLSISDRARILAMLCEGMSMRAVSRLADVSINTVSKLLVELRHYRSFLVIEYSSHHDPPIMRFAALFRISVATAGLVAGLFIGSAFMDRRRFIMISS